MSHLRQGYGGQGRDFPATPPPCSWPPVGIVETLAWLSWKYGIDQSGTQERRKNQGRNFLFSSFPDSQPSGDTRQ